MRTGLTEAEVLDMSEEMYLTVLEEAQTRDEWEAKRSGV